MAAQDEHTPAEGIWQFQREVPVPDDHGKLANDVFTFTYRGGTVTLRLLTLRSGQFKSDDDFYKLSARWEGPTLYYHPPFGPWTELATFEDDRFVNVGSGKMRIFQRVEPGGVVNWNKGILTEGRALHDYRIRPDEHMNT